MAEDDTSYVARTWLHTSHPKLSDFIVDQLPQIRGGLAKLTTADAAMNPAYEDCIDYR